MDEEIKKIIDQAKSEIDVFHKAKLLLYLIKEKDIPINRLANLLSTSSSYLCHLIRLLRLPEIIIDGYYSKITSVSHLMTVSRLNNEEEMIAVYEQILSKNLTVSQTDELVRQRLYQIKTNGKGIDNEVKRQIEESLKKIDKDMQVKVIQTRIQAKIIMTIKGNNKKTTEALKKIYTLHLSRQDG